MLFCFFLFLAPISVVKSRSPVDRLDRQTPHVSTRGNELSGCCGAPQSPVSLLTDVLSYQKSACHLMVASALAALNDLQSPNVNFIFRKDDAATRATLVAQFQAIDNTCTGAADPGISISPSESIWLSINPLWSFTVTTTMMLPQPTPMTKVVVFGVEECQYGNVYAVAYTQENVIALCDTWYDAPVVPDPNNCWSISQPHILVHELTHLPSVINPPTDDIAYGASVVNVDVAQTLLNADSYAVFATQSFLGCVNGNPPDPPNTDALNTLEDIFFQEPCACTDS